MDAEALFFSALLQAGSPVGLREVRREHLDAHYQAVFDYCADFVRQQGKLPRATTVEGHFGRPLPPADEPLVYYADAIRQNAKRVALEEGLTEKVGKPLQEQRPDEALRGLRDVTTDIASRFREPERGLFLDDMAANVDVRRRAYKLRERTRDRAGLPTPFPTLTRATGGYQPGEVWAVLARMNKGKSWWLICSAVHLWQMGFRVLFASMETPPQSALPKDPRHRVVNGNCVRCALAGANPDEQCEAALTPQQRLSIRFDALGARVSAWRLLKGLLTPQERERLDAYWGQVQTHGGGRWGQLRITGAPIISSVSDLETEVLDYRPDVVFWDSAYLAAPTEIDSTWGTKRNPAGELIVATKLMAERVGVPVIISWHFNRDVDEKATNASVNNAALTDEVGRVLDVLIGLFRPPELEQAGEAIQRTLKVRDGIWARELRTRFSVKDVIDFSEIGDDVPGRPQEEGVKKS